MNRDGRRYKISREEIGILLSFARRPEAATREWTTRLVAGVTEAELLEFFGAAGLPMSEASRIMAAATNRGIPVDNKWSDRSAGYRRAVLGVLLVYVLVATALTIAAGSTPVQTVSLVSVLVVSALVVHKAIVRLSAGSRPHG